MRGWFGRGRTHHAVAPILATVRHKIGIGTTQKLRLSGMRSSRARVRTTLSARAPPVCFVCWCPKARSFVDLRSVQARGLALPDSGARAPSRAAWERELSPLKPGAVRRARPSRLPTPSLSLVTARDARAQAWLTAFDQRRSTSSRSGAAHVSGTWGDASSRAARTARVPRARTTRPPSARARRRRARISQTRPAAKHDPRVAARAGQEYRSNVRARAPHPRARARSRRGRGTLRRVPALVARGRSLSLSRRAVRSQTPTTSLPSSRSLAPSPRARR